MIAYFCFFLSYLIDNLFLSDLFYFTLLLLSYDEDQRVYDGEWRHGRWHGFGRAKVRQRLFQHFVLDLLGTLSRHYLLAHFAASAVPFSLQMATPTRVNIDTISGMLCYVSRCQICYGIVE